MKLAYVWTLGLLLNTNALAQENPPTPLQIRLQAIAGTYRNNRGQVSQLPVFRAEISAPLADRLRLEGLYDFGSGQGVRTSNLDRPIAWALWTPPATTL